MLVKLVRNDGVVAVLAVILDLLEDLRVLREDLPHEELLTQCESFDLRNGNKNELGLKLVAQVEISEERIRVEALHDDVAVLVKRLLVQVVTDTHIARHDEVHLLDFFLFV